MHRFVRTFFCLILLFLFYGCTPKRPIAAAAGKVLAGVDLEAVTDDLVLPVEVDSVAIEWISSEPTVVSATGVVNRQEEDVTVVLYGYFSYQDKLESHKYILTVIGLKHSLTDRLEYVKKTLLRGQEGDLSSDLVLPAEVNDVAISWISSNPDVLTHDGKINPQDEAVTVNLYAYLSYGGKNETRIFTFTVLPYDQADMEKIESVLDGLLAGVDKEHVTSDLDFPREIDGVALVWTSALPDAIDDDGIVYRGGEDVTVAVTVELSCGTAKASATFTFIVLADDSADYALVSQVKAGLLAGVQLDAVTEDLELPTNISGVDIAWKSSDPAVVTAAGRIFRAETDKTVTLTATLTLNRVRDTKAFALQVLAREDVIDDWEWLLAVKESLLAEEDLDNVTGNLYFPPEVGEVAIIWESDNPAVIDREGGVMRGSADVIVVVTAHLTYKDLSDEAVFIITVKKIEQTLSDYYRGAEGLSGDALKAFLHNIIKDHRTYSYDDTADLLKQTDEDPDNPNNVILFYTGRSESKSAYSSQVWNKEHVWAKSHGDFGTKRPAGSDIHNLRPTDAQMNSTRGNKDFDEGGSKVNVNRGYGPGSSFSYSDSDSFEPRAEVKGDVARILFYMATRYEGEKGEPDLELNDRVNNGSAAYHGRISVLIRWHHEDPVDDFERNRNEVIYSYQGNRNPFIDYPEFADMIWGSKATTSAVDAILNLIAPIVVDPDAFRRNKFTLFTT